MTGLATVHPFPMLALSADSAGSGGGQPPTNPKHPLNLILAYHGGKTYGLEFKHSRKIFWPQGCTDIRQVPAKNVARVTRCRIYELVQGRDEQEILSEAKATCRHPDNFVKSTGRKKSLTSALRTFSNKPLLDRDTREAVWKAYWASLANDQHRSLKQHLATFTQQVMADIHPAIH